MEERLPSHIFRVLRSAGEEASLHHFHLYMVGGVVRDLLLGRKILDLDLVIEGDAIPLARSLAQKLGGRARTHPHFGTATLELGGFRVDLATARSESYPTPGALPEVRTGSLQEDLARRDFSINAMALCLDPEGFGELVDPLGGWNDLREGRIRVLHESSFLDDPTRIFRAVRYEQRLCFQIEAFTEELIRKHRSALASISGERLRHELELILEEEEPERMLHRLEELGALEILHPSLRGSGWIRERFIEVRESWHAEFPLAELYLGLLLYPLSRGELQEVLSRLKMRGGRWRWIESIANVKGELPRLAEASLPRSLLFWTLEDHSAKAVMVVALACPPGRAKGQLLLYLKELRHIRPFLSGEALKVLGVPSGPRLGRMLRALQEARLDGKVHSQEDEEALVRFWIAREAHKS